MFKSLAYITLGGNLVVKHTSLVFILLIAISGSIQAQEDRSVVKAFLTDTAPELDGEISPGEWDAAGPPIQVIPEDPGTAFPDDPFGGPDDLSFPISRDVGTAMDRLLSVRSHRRHRDGPSTQQCLGAGSSRVIYGWR